MAAHSAPSSSRRTQSARLPFILPHCLSLPHLLYSSLQPKTQSFHCSFPRKEMNGLGFMKKVIGTAVRYFSNKPKPKMKPIELKTPPEQTQTITRVIFDVVKEHGPLTVGETWEHVKNVGVRGLTSKRHMKIILRWMRERQKLRMICNHVGPHKQFLYTTWFTNPKAMPLPKRASPNPGASLPSIHPK